MPQAKEGGTTMNRVIGIAIVLALLLGVFWGVVSAQEIYEEEWEPIVVEGQIQRPHAFYILQRANMEFGMQAKRQSFIYLIEQSIEEVPF